MIHPPQSRIKDLTAFCAVCPDSSVVTVLLEDLGFSLVFSMPKKTYWRGKTQILPDLPAQFHYRDRHGTEVVFMAGKDTADGVGNKYPNHASRWWLYVGSSPYAFTRSPNPECSIWYPVAPASYSRLLKVLMK